MVVVSGREVTMMRLKIRDLVGSVLFLAIAVPYVGFLVRGEMPFIRTELEMSAVGLLLGAAAFLVMHRGDRLDRSRSDEVVPTVALVLGLTSLVFAGTALAPWLLAVFMGSLLVLWAFELSEHAGWIHPANGAPVHG
jgi:hypothetical protein